MTVRPTNADVMEKLEEVLTELAATKSEVEKLRKKATPVIEVYDAVAKTGKVLSWAGRAAVWLVAIAAALGFVVAAIRLAATGSVK